MSKHTPDNPFPKLGLGSVGRFNNGQYVEADDEAFVSSEGEDPDYEIAIKGPEAKRVARLIAAAPELLAALTALNAVLDFSDEYGCNEATVIDDPTAINEAFALARAALSKARAT